MYWLLELNPQLMNFAGDIDFRMFLYCATKSRLLPKGGKPLGFTHAHHYYGFHHVKGG